MANARQRVDAILFGIFGKGFADLPPSVRDALLNSADMNAGLRAAKEEMLRLSSQRAIGTTAPGRSPIEADVIDYPIDSMDSAPKVEIVTGRAKPAPAPVAPEGGKDAAKVAGDGFFRKALTPVSMDVPRREFLPGDFRPDDTAGDAIRKILGYGVVPGAAVGMAARQLAEGGGVPVWVSGQEQETPDEQPPQRMLNDDILRALRDSTTRQQGAAYPRN